MNVSLSLILISNYPIPQAVAEKIAGGRGLNPEDNFTSELSASAAYKLAVSDVYEYLSTAPEITQAGITFKVTDELRKKYAGMTSELRGQYGSSQDINQIYGLTGEEY